MRSCNSSHSNIFFHNAAVDFTLSFKTEIIIEKMKSLDQRHLHKENESFQNFQLKNFLPVPTLGSNFDLSMESQTINRNHELKNSPD